VPIRPGLYFAQATDTARRSQSRMMGSASFLGWGVVGLFVVLAVLGPSPGFLAAALVLGAAMVTWEVLKYRRAHRWDRLEARAARQPHQSPPHL
jgi:Flp pilus assembly protein TadB